MKQLLLTSLIILSATIFSNAQCYDNGPKKNRSGNSWQDRMDNVKDNYNERKNRRSVVESPKKAIFVEWRGNGIGKSINFDSRFSNARNGLGLRVGIGATEIDYDSDSENQLTYDALTIPAEINYLFGKRRHSLEAGVGFTTILEQNDSNFGGQAFLSFGYRFKPIRKGIVFRFNYTPTFDAEGLEFGKTGVSLGWGF